MALLLGPMFSEFMALVAALSMSLLMFVLPPVFYWRILGPGAMSARERAMCGVLFAVGVVCCVTTLITSTTDLVHYFVAGKEDLCAGE